MADPGRPTGYNETYCQRVDDYLAENQDEVDAVVESENEKTGRIRYESRLKVRLPTIEGFARYVDVPRRTIFDWRNRYEEFSHSLDKILIEQQQRLLEKGLSGEYNSTIAKLILSSNHGMTDKQDITSGGKPLTLTFDKAFDEASRETTGYSEESSSV